MPISNSMSVVAMLNGMIGGIILVMPILSIRTGWALIAPITIIMGFFSYYSCLLCLKHLKNYPDLDVAVLKHFNNKRSYKVFYDIIIVIGMSALLMEYFKLISDQWYSIITQTKIIPILNAIALFPIVYIMRKFDFGASLLGYGILSIIGYCIFLFWMFIDSPSGDNQFKAADPLFSDLAAALAQGFTIQTFFIPILKQNPKSNMYKTLLSITYIAGILIYTYIGYAGGFSVLNRKLQQQSLQTIEDYFGQKQWQVVTLQILYLVHLYSAFPQFLLVSKKRFFSILKWQQTQEVNFKEVIYVAITILICLIILLIGVQVKLIIQLNGSILSFFFIVVIPIGLHVKCKYFTKQEDRHHKWEDQNQHKSQRSQQNKSQIQKKKQQNINEKDIQLPKLDNNAIKTNGNFNDKNINANKQQISSDLDAKTDQDMRSQMENNKNQQDNQGCKCDIQHTHKIFEIIENIILLLMILTGLAIMFYTLFNLISGRQKEADEGEGTTNSTVRLLFQYF